MDRKKSKTVSSPNLLEAGFTRTPLGFFCNKKEIVCLRCRKKVTIEIPDDLFKDVVHEELLGDEIINTIIRDVHYWVLHSFCRPNGNKAIFMLCPDCIEKDFVAFSSSPSPA